MKIICRIKDLRKEKDLTQEELAKKLGISRQSIISVETGKSTPSLPLALEIADLFQSTIEEIFGIGRSYHKSPSVFHRAMLSKNLGTKETKMTRDLLPWRPFGMGRFFDEDWSDAELPKSLAVSAPAINVYEEGKNVVVECHLPGINPDDVRIDVANDLVKISGEKKAETEEKEKNYYRKEISYSTFARSVALPKKVKSAKAEADYNDGILKITLPKVGEKAAKTIKVKVKKKR